MKFMRTLTLVVIGLLVTSTAWAQDGEQETVENEKFNVSIAPPDGWDVDEASDKAIANFTHSGSQSQIEVIATDLMTSDVADVFFETFHKTLKDSDFEKKSESSETIADYSGTETTYQFTHSGVTLNVLVFEFTRDNTAWLVVGYFQDTETKDRREDYETVIENISFND